MEEIIIPNYREYCRNHIFEFPVLADIPKVNFKIAGIHPLKQREVLKLKKIVDKYKFYPTCMGYRKRLQSYVYGIQRY